MKWDIDRELRRLEPEVATGTIITRVLMNTNDLKEHKIKPTKLQLERGTANVWSLGLGIAMMPKVFFTGQTLHECFLKARRAAKENKLAEHTPWGSKTFKPKPKERKKKVKKHE